MKKINLYTLSLLLVSLLYFLNIGEQLISTAQAASTLRIIESSEERSIKSDGIADHQTGAFPNRNNPNQISSQSYHFKMPLNPEKSSQVTEMRSGLFGVALNGIPFDPGTAETWNNDRSWRMEAIGGSRNLGLDKSNAHVQPNGAYHYHGMPNAFINGLDHLPNKPTLIGYAADGFPIYNDQGHVIASDTASPINTLKSSYQLKTQTRINGPSGSPDGSYTRDFVFTQGYGDLDRCNGRDGATAEYPKGTYYYVLTTKFPFVPRCWVGTPDSSFKKARPHSRERKRSSELFGSRPSAPWQGRSNDGPPPEAIDACKGKTNQSSCRVDTPRGELIGSCRKVPSDELACVPGFGRPR